ncbi:unnamed protein product, partial [Prorocentrum cordatum]
MFGAFGGYFVLLVQNPPCGGTGSTELQASDLEGGPAPRSARGPPGGPPEQLGAGAVRCSSADGGEAGVLPELGFEEAGVLLELGFDEAAEVVDQDLLEGVRAALGHPLHRACEPSEGLVDYYR